MTDVRLFQILEGDSIRGPRIVICEPALKLDNINTITKVLDRNSVHGAYMDVQKIINPFNEEGINLLCPTWEFDDEKKTEGMKEFLVGNGFSPTSFVKLDKRARLGV